MKYQVRTEELFDFSHTVAGDFLKKCEYPWQALEHIGEWIVTLGQMLPAVQYEQVAECVWIAKSARIAPSASIP